MGFEVELVTEIASIDAAHWDALVGEDDPFIEHAFLLALEQSGSVGGRQSGWIPLHVTVRDAGRLVGAMPCYVKLHSYGEYIFDWRWAASAERAGIAYYPKLVSMVPFTPATGKRLLWANDVEPGTVVAALAQGVEAARAQLKASSVHWLFLNEDERAVVQAHTNLMSRESLQFHWHNQGYASFEAYLERFRSALRKQVRKERRQALDAGLEIRVLPGPELGDLEWSALYAFYVDTCEKRGSGPYLNRRFFERIRATHARRVLAVLAYRDAKPVAGTLNFHKGRHLYGRYWGCSEDVPGLHFECCYYRLIEYAIEHGLSRFEAGAQGTHKLRRGLLPAVIHSAHNVTHPALRDAIRVDLAREINAVRFELAGLAEHGPFRRD